MSSSSFNFPANGRVMPSAHLNGSRTGDLGIQIRCYEVSIYVLIDSGDYRQLKSLTVTLAHLFGNICESNGRSRQATSAQNKELSHGFLTNFLKIWRTIDRLAYKTWSRIKTLQLNLGILVENIPHTPKSRHTRASLETC
jgi:hypothetical protein